MGVILINDGQLCEKAKSPAIPRDSSIKQQMLFSHEVYIYSGSAVMRQKKS